MTQSISSSPSSAPSAYSPQAAEPQASKNAGTGAPTGAYGRPAGDHRGAEKIFSDNPALKDVLKQDGPFSNDFLNKLKQQTGDWGPANDNPESRADAAYNLSEVVNHIDGREGLKRQGSSQQGDHRMQGFGQFGSVSAGSEAQLLKAFSEKGYSALQ